MLKVIVVVVALVVAACAEPYAPVATNVSEVFADDTCAWLEARGFSTIKRENNGRFDVDVPADRVDAAISTFVVDERGTRGIKAEHEPAMLPPTKEQRALAAKVEETLLKVPGYTAAHVIVSTPAPFVPRPDDHTQWLHLREPTVHAHVVIAYVAIDARNTAPSADGSSVHGAVGSVMDVVAKAIGGDPRDVQVRLYKVMPPLE